jgi:hypothetical protein
MFEIEFTPDAVDDLTLFRKFDRQFVFDRINEQLLYEPLRHTIGKDSDQIK